MLQLRRDRITIEHKSNVESSECPLSANVTSALHVICSLGKTISIDQSKLHTSLNKQAWFPPPSPPLL